MTLGANMRFIPHQGEKESLEIIKALAAKHGLETEIVHSNDYTEPVDINGEAFKLVEKVIGETFPCLPVSPYVMTGATDAQFYQPICPTPVGGRTASRKVKGKETIFRVGDCVAIGNLRTVIWRAWDVCMKI